jgi:hypothetical protein
MPSNMHPNNKFTTEQCNKRVTMAYQLCNNNTTIGTPMPSNMPPNSNGRLPMPTAGTYTLIHTQPLGLSVRIHQNTCTFPWKENWNYIHNVHTHTHTSIEMGRMPMPKSGFVDTVAPRTPTNTGRGNARSTVNARGALTRPTTMRTLAP